MQIQLLQMLKQSSRRRRTDQRIQASNRSRITTLPMCNLKATQKKSWLQLLKNGPKYACEKNVSGTHMKHWFQRYSRDPKSFWASVPGVRLKETLQNSSSTTENPGVYNLDSFTHKLCLVIGNSISKIYKVRMAYKVELLNGSVVVVVE